jgi:hypothetical protein
MSTRPSLRSFLPTLGKILNVSPVTLFERQRALVRAQILSTGDCSSPERGPGSGVFLNNGAAAILLISMLASPDSLKTAADKTNRLMRARYLKPERGRGLCLFPTLARTLDDPTSKYISDIDQIVASGDANRAAIYLRCGSIENFAGPKNKTAEHGLLRLACINGNDLRTIHKALHKALDPVP